MNTLEDEVINTLLEIIEPDASENGVNTTTTTASLSPSRKKPRIKIDLHNTIMRNVTKKCMTVRVPGLEIPKHCCRRRVPVKAFPIKRRRDNNFPQSRF